MRSSTELNDKLRDLSSILIKEENRLLCQHSNFIDDFNIRSSELWRAYFSSGIMLASGGVETSLFGLKDIQNPTLNSFNDYPGSSNAYASLTQELCKHFLLEEGIISPLEEQKSLVVAYSFGSHEGLIRAARNTYKRNYNDGFFIPIGSYGLIPAALRDLKPLKYDICLVNVDSSQGDKILLSHLDALVKKHPTVKSLFIQIKTTVGAVYTESEIKDIIVFCKTHQLFLFIDVAHLHMEFDPKYKFPAVSSLCQELEYFDYIVFFTGSKTYGLERARVGFVLFHNRNRALSLEAMDNQFIRMFGTFSDFPIVATHHLLHVPLSERRKYVKSNIDKHRYNMNLMLAYIDGIHSKKIDLDLIALITSEIPDQYRSGIEGLRVVFKPESGMHIKVDLSQFKDKYFFNIQMFNAEIFCYALNIICGVVTIHSYQFMDPSGYGMRLSFSSRNDVHTGMQMIHGFIGLLTDRPQLNPYMNKIISIDSLVSKRIDKATVSDKPGLFLKANSVTEDVARKSIVVIKPRL